jgi:hypothetical protein
MHGQHGSVTLSRNDSAPSERIKALNIAVHCERFKSEESYLSDLLEHLSIPGCLKIYLHTFDGEHESIDFTDNLGWVCYAGEMDAKTWQEEWA